MIIKQLSFSRETIFEYATRDDVYIVQPQKSRSDKIPDRPFGLAFKSIKNVTLPELIIALEKNEVALVSATW